MKNEIRKDQKMILAFSALAIMPFQKDIVSLSVCMMSSFLFLIFIFSSTISVEDKSLKIIDGFIYPVSVIQAVLLIDIFTDFVSGVFR